MNERKIINYKAEKLESRCLYYNKEKCLMYYSGAQRIINWFVKNTLISYQESYKILKNELNRKGIKYNDSKGTKKIYLNFCGELAYYVAEKNYYLKNKGT